MDTKSTHAQTKHRQICFYDFSFFIAQNPLDTQEYTQNTNSKHDHIIGHNTPNSFILMGFQGVLWSKKNKKNQNSSKFPVFRYSYCPTNISYFLWVWPHSHDTLLSSFASPHALFISFKSICIDKIPFRPFSIPTNHTCYFPPCEYLLYISYNGWITF